MKRLSKGDVSSRLAMFIGWIALFYANSVLEVSAQDNGCDDDMQPTWWNNYLEEGLQRGSIAGRGRAKRHDQESADIEAAEEAKSDVENWLRLRLYESASWYAQVHGGDSELATPRNIKSTVDYLVQEYTDKCLRVRGELFRRCDGQLESYVLVEIEAREIPENASWVIIGELSGRRTSRNSDLFREVTDKVAEKLRLTGSSILSDPSGYEGTTSRKWDRPGGFTLRVGLARGIMTNRGGMTDGRNVTGANGLVLGITAPMKTSGTILLQNDLLYVRKSSNITHNMNESPDSNYAGMLRLNYLVVNPSVLWFASSSIYCLLGTELGFLVSAIRDSASISDYDTKLTPLDVKHEYNAFDLGISTGIGVFHPGNTLSVELRFYYGLKNARREDTSSRNQGIYALLGFRFSR